MRRVSLALFLAACSSGAEPGDSAPAVQDLPPESAAVDSVRLVHLSPLSSGTCAVTEPSAGPIQLSQLEPQANVRAYVYWSYIDSTRAGIPYRDCSVGLGFTIEPGSETQLSVTQTGPQTATVDRVESGANTARLIAAFGSDPANQVADTLVVQQTQ